MSLIAQCPRCGDDVLAAAPAGPETGSGADPEILCPAHGPVAPLWRPDVASYDDFGAHLLAADAFPTWLPWPLGPGWRVADFGRVGGGRTSATMTRVAGESPVDGRVDFSLVAEEPGTGLGARCAGLAVLDPGVDVGVGRPVAQVRMGSHPVPLWQVSTSTDADRDFDRTVLAGEAEGRWLWLVVRPAPAVLLLAGDWQLADAATMGPALIEVPFGP